MPGYIIIIFIVAALIWIDVVCIVASVFMPRNKLEKFIDKAGPVWSRRILNIIALYAGTDIRIHKPDPKSIPAHCIVLANHQNFLDILVLFALFDSLTLRFVGKASLNFGFPGVSTFLRLGRHAFVKQTGDPMGAVESVRKFARRNLKMGLSPVIFPEGTRQRDGVLGEFKTGGLRIIADHCPLPYVVVALDGGQTLNKLADLSPRAYLRAEVMGTFPSAPSKKETAAMLAEAHQLIDRKIQDWRKARAS